MRDHEYAWSREEILAEVRRCLAESIPVSLDMLTEKMLQEMVSDADITWARRRARRWGFVAPIIPESPLLEQQLAMDT